MLSLKQHITIFDLETGGLSPKRHPIIQIGAVRMSLDLQSYKTFECKVQFDTKKADPTALSMNSYDADAWEAEAIPAKVAAEKFAAFLKQGADVHKISKRSGKAYKVAQLAAHNASFDSGFIFPWFKNLGVYLPAEWHVIDTIQLAALYGSITGDRPSSLSLSALADHFEIELNDAHDALADAVATAKLARILLTELTGRG